MEYYSKPLIKYVSNFSGNSYAQRKAEALYAYYLGKLSLRCQIDF